MSHVDDGTLHALVDDALDAAERRAVEAHLAACGDCARRFADATAMARQVVTLLGALDAPAAPVVVRATAPVPTVRLRGRAPLLTLRRVAMAASVLLVAGISYQMGRSQDGAPAPLERPQAVRLPATAAPMRAMPSVVDGAMDSMASAPVASARCRGAPTPRGGPRVEGEVAYRRPGCGHRTRAVTIGAATDCRRRSTAPPAATSPRVAAAEAQLAPRDAPEAERRARTLNDAPVAASARARPTAGEAVVAVQAAQSAQESRDESRDEWAVPPRLPPEALRRRRRWRQHRRPCRWRATARSRRRRCRHSRRRRYVSATGTSLELSITQSVASAGKALMAAGDASAFVVTTDGGRSTVRWSARGVEYILQGPLAPDSLVKLATQLQR
ncbi:MAG: zf-HC2 domain-containing protein [Gemmatimonadaceae bacterium]|nr:zf-HC2 domain-containing protein [Gemmatimonadaceae bacterium]